LTSNAGSSRKCRLPRPSYSFNNASQCKSKIFMQKTPLMEYVYLYSEKGTPFISPCSEGLVCYKYLAILSFFKSCFPSLRLFTYLKCLRKKRTFLKPCVIGLLLEQLVWVYSLLLDSLPWQIGCIKSYLNVFHLI